MLALPVLAAALALGIVAADAAALGVAVGEVAIAKGLGLGLALRRRPALRLACAALAVAGAGVHGLALQREAAHWPASRARVEATVEGRVVSLARRGDAAWAVLDGVRRVDGGGDPLPPRLRVQSELAPGGFAAIASSGDRVRVRVRVRPVVGRANPGLPDPALRLRRAGIGGEGALVHPALAARAPRGPAQSVRAAAATLRRDAADRLAARGAGLAAALALGERGRVDPASEEALRAAGLSHLLSVSGLHLALAAGLFFAGARIALLAFAPHAFADPRRAALALAWAGAAGYAALTGFDVPVRRSLVFLTVASGAALARRPAHGASLVAAAALLVLAREPDALFDPGARLSFAAAAALVLARPPARDPEPPPLGWRARTARALDASLRASAAALAASAPLAALHFGRVAPAALAANLAAVPLTGLLVLPASLAAGAAAFVAPGWPGLAAAPAEASRLGGAALDALARLAASGPGAERVVAPGAGSLALATACALAALRVRGTSARIGAAALGHAALLLAPPPSAWPDAPRVVALDVGQGDATLVQGRAAALLVDAAGGARGGADPGRSLVRPALAALGVRRLDVVAVSHADLDHRGGAPGVLETVPVDRLWLPPGALADPAYGALLDVARRRRVRVETPARGAAPLVLGDLRVEVLWPPRELPGGDNDRSLVLRVGVAGGARVLLPGDVEHAGEAGLLASPERLEAEVLKLSHHGSRTSSSDAFLRAVGARVALASAPCLGRFAMPHPDVAARVAAAGASLWWTGREGAVAVGLAQPLVARGFAARSLRERAFCGGR